MSSRPEQFKQWLSANLATDQITLLPLPGDASFRKYYRVKDHPGILAVDAPPEHEKTQEFVEVANAYAHLGLHVPDIRAYSIDLGFLIVSDLGNTPYLHILQSNPTQADKLYNDALGSLLRISTCDSLELASFDGAFMGAELENFTHWFVASYLREDLSEGLQRLLNRSYQQLIARAEAQKQVSIHRDYHSRNLMVCDGKNPGILDFQDAMRGPITYDCISLLRDCYIDWPKAKVEVWAKNYYYACQSVHRDWGVSETQFVDDFNWMGIQRHLKASFIFARKFLRDGNAGYLADIPRTIGYIADVSAHYPELKELHRFITDRVQPVLPLLTSAP